MLPFSTDISFVSDLRLVFTYGNKKAVKISLQSMHTSFIAQMPVFKKNTSEPYFL